MRYRHVPDEEMLQGIVSTLSEFQNIVSALDGLSSPKPKVVTWYQRWFRFLRTKPSGPFWHEHPER